MSIPIRQSTAFEVIVGPILDADGVAVTDAVIGDLKLSKNGGAPAAFNGSATLTHRHTGYYSLAGTTSDSGTVGFAQVTCDDGTNAMAPVTLLVLEEAIYDALYAASATGLLPANMTQIAGQTASAAGTVTFPGTIASTTNITAGTITTTTNLTNLPTMPTDWVSSTGVSAAAVTKIQSGLALEATLTSMKGAGFDTSTDSLEALRNRGDAAWTTAVGFSTHAASDVWSVGTRLLTAGTNIVLAKGTGITGFNDLDAAGVRTAVGLGSANLDTQLGDIPTVSEFEARTIVAANYATSTALSTVDSNVVSILADTDELQTNQGNWLTADVSLLATQASVDGLNDLDATAVEAAVAAALAAIDAIPAAGLSAAACNKIADHVRRRTQANVEGSSDGDSLSLGSEYGFIQQAQESAVSAGTMTVYRTDGATQLGTKTLTSDAEAEPITGVS